MFSKTTLSATVHRIYLRIKSLVEATQECAFGPQKLMQADTLRLCRIEYSELDTPPTEILAIARYRTNGKI
jgi:hypothetical protein